MPEAAPTQPAESPESLLARVQTLHELLEANRREPFNVFTALRKSHEEVNLHSRFLHAMLSHRDADGRRPYLRMFLSSIEKTSEFASDAESAVVMREHRNIDLLITHRNPDWAVIIENKIHAGDQPQQLVRYHKVVVNDGFCRSSISVLYLTLDGRKASPDSTEYTDENGRKTGDRVPYDPISYADNLLPWLVSCQQQAYDDPALRESIAQYRTVVEQLTGHSRGGPYMDKLTDLCVRNLPIVLDLTNALVDAKHEILSRVWTEIGRTVGRRLGMRGAALSRKTKAPVFGDNGISDMLKPPSVLNDWHCLLWPLRKDGGGGGALHPAPAIAVEINGDGLMYGIRCQDATHAEIEEILRDFRTDVRGNSNDWWPWRTDYAAAFNAATPRARWSALASLANDEEKCRKFAGEIARTLEEIRTTLRAKTPGLVDEL